MIIMKWFSSSESRGPPWSLGLGPLVGIGLSPRQWNLLSFWGPIRTTQLWDISLTIFLAEYNHFSSSDIGCNILAVKYLLSEYPFYHAIEFKTFCSLQNCLIFHPRSQPVKVWAISTPEKTQAPKDQIVKSESKELASESEPTASL